MPDYRRYRVPGGGYFFTVNWLERYPNDRLTRPIEIVQEAVRPIRQGRPLHIDAMLPDHLHCLSTLPPGNDDLPTRWRLIKTLFVKRLPKTERRSTVRESRGEHGVWQRR